MVQKLFQTYLSNILYRLNEHFNVGFISKPRF